MDGKELSHVLRNVCSSAHVRTMKDPKEISELSKMDVSHAVVCIDRRCSVSYGECRR
jgi:hypothetical protein